MDSSIFAGASGLQAYQQQIDVIGNNIANVGTPGFKSQRVDFADLFYQTLQGATAPSGNLGGTDPLQIGLGTRVGAVGTSFLQGSLDATARDLDFAIQGNGFFAVNNGTANVFTRAGNFDVNSQQLLVDAITGFPVQRFGTIGEGGGGLPAFQTPGDTNIVIPFGIGVPGQATSNVTVQGNLDAATPIGGQSGLTTIPIFDSQGTAHTLSLQFTKTAANTWSLTGSIPATEGVVLPNTIAGITFDNSGIFQGPVGATMAFTITSPNPLPAQTVTFNLGTVGQTNGLTQFGGAITAAPVSQDGFAAGFLDTVTVGLDGIINGVFTNGEVFPIAQMALATFINPGGLERLGTNFFGITAQSGTGTLGAPLSGGAGSVNQGFLEGSNVDQTTELVLLLIAQQAFEANADTVRVSSEILQTAANLIQ
jgi:flagellar hook protein FlgE